MKDKAKVFLVRIKDSLKKGQSKLLENNKDLQNSWRSIILIRMMYRDQEIKAMIITKVQNQYRKLDKKYISKLNDFFYH